MTSASHDALEQCARAANLPLRATPCPRSPPGPATARHGLNGLYLQLQALDQFGGNGGDALLRRCRKRHPRIGMRIVEHDPQTRAIHIVVARTNRAGELRQLQRRRSRVREIEIRILRRVRLEWRVSQKLHQDAAGVVHQVAEALRNQNSRLHRAAWAAPIDRDRNPAAAFPGDLDGAGRLVWIRDDSHVGYIWLYTTDAYFG